jgi:hypothetical protein
MVRRLYLKVFCIHAHLLLNACTNTDVCTYLCECVCVCVCVSVYVCDFGMHTCKFGVNATCLCFNACFRAFTYKSDLYMYVCVCMCGCICVCITKTTVYGRLYIHIHIAYMHTYVKA